MRETTTTRAILGAILVLVALAPVPALATSGGPLEIEILVGGVPLAEYAARGTTYVEALEGRDYAVRLRNLTGERIGVALAVDGLSSIDARATTARAARKWILGPFESATISGWQTGSRTARRFYFTTERKSYGAWLGMTENLGVISAAAFRERRRHPALAIPSGRLDAPAARESEAPAAPNRGERAGDAGARLKAAAKDEYAATGIGREIEHGVREVAFEPEDDPVSVVSVRYEYRDALVRLGVLPVPRDDEGGVLARRERSRGFREPGFAPDPYR